MIVGIRGVAVALGVLALAACQSDSVTFQSRDYLGGPARSVSGLLFRPSGDGRHPAVMLLHTCGGLTPHMREDWPQFLTGLGYVVFSVDTLGSRGFTSCTQLPGGYIKQATDAYNALDYLAGLPFVDADRVAVMGFSMGARSINRVIVNESVLRGTLGSLSERDFKAAIALYGSCFGVPGPAELRFPLLEIAAEHDSHHMPSCRGLPSGERYEVRVIEGAYHAFDQPQITQMRNDPGGSKMLYDASAAAQARALTKEFLARHLDG